MNEQKQLSYIDILSIASFVIGLMNLEENLTQSDKQELQKDLSAKTDLLLAEIHAHLKKQDKQIEEILKCINSMT